MELGGKGQVQRACHLRPDRSLHLALCMQVSSNPFNVPGEIDCFIPFSQMSKLRFLESSVPGLEWRGALLVHLDLTPLGAILFLLKTKTKKA